MANVKALKIGNTSYDIRDENSLRSVDSTKYDEVTTYGTYDGVDVDNGEVFTNETGKFQEFSKVQETGETAFSEKEDFPGSTSTMFVTKIIRNVGGVDTPFYMAVGGGKCFTSNDGTFGATQTSSVGISDYMNFGPLYANGIWIVENNYGEASSSRDDGETWIVHTGGNYPVPAGVVGNYFYGINPNNGYRLSTDDTYGTYYAFSGVTAMTYDGEYYVMLAGDKIYKTTTPTDVDSWVQVTTISGWYISQDSTLKYSNGKYYAGYADGWGNYHYFYTSDLTATNWTAFSQTFGDNSGYTSAWLKIIGDIVFVFYLDRYGVITIYMTSDFGQTFTTVSNPNQYATVVGDELWYVTGGKVYSLDPNPHWVYNLTDMSLTKDETEALVSPPELSDIAQAGDGIKIKDAKEENFTTTGNITITDGVASGFSSSSYIETIPAFNPSSFVWEFKMKFTTSSNVTTWNELFHSYPYTGNRYGICVDFGETSDHFGFFCSGNGSSWIFDVVGSYSVLPNTTYYIKFGWDGSKYYLDYSLDDETYVRDIEYTSSTPIYNSLTKTAFGLYFDGNRYPFLGDLDLTGCSGTVGGVEVWKAYDVSDKAQISVDIGSGVPTSSTEGYVGKVSVDSSGNAYMCVGVSGSTYTWKQITLTSV